MEDYRALLWSVLAGVCRDLCLASDPSYYLRMHSMLTSNLRSGRGVYLPYFPRKREPTDRVLPPPTCWMTAVRPTTRTDPTGRQETRECHVVLPVYASRHRHPSG